MGGNIFKNGSTRRVTAAEFDNIQKTFTDRLKAAHPYVHFEVLKAYGDKPDFGNLSIFALSDGPSTDEQLLAFMRDCTIDGKAATNGNRVSIPFMGIQTDVTLVPADNYRFALSYHAFNGMGGLLGRVAHSLDLTLRDDGMVYKLFDDDQAVAEIGVAVTWQQALMLLGYSYGRWCEGFASFDEVFAFVASSEFFDSAMFMDVEAAVEGDRPTVVQLFAQYLQAASRPSFKVSTKTLEVLFDRIPGFCESYADVSGQWTAHKAQQKVISTKFNGHMVAKWTGRSGRALGELMQFITKTFGSKEDVGMWVLSSSAENIQAMVMEQHQQLNEQQQPA